MNSTLNSSHKVPAIHLWKYCLQKPVRDASISILSTGEKEVMGRLSRYEDRKEYFQVHVFLKKVLELYTHLPPEEIQLVEDENGKPFLKCYHSNPPLYFSLSYRNEYALLALSSEPCVGVDVEEVKPMENLFQFMVDHFSKEERRWILNEKTEKRQLSLMFTFWAMKEAFLKSIAVGLSSSIKKYEMLSFLKKPFGMPAFGSGSEWCIDRIPIAKNYKAAYALKAGKVSSKVFDYNDVQES